MLPSFAENIGTFFGISLACEFVVVYIQEKIYSCNSAVGGRPHSTGPSTSGSGGSGAGVR